MKANGLVRLTRDSELAYANTGTAVLKFAVAYDTGFGDKKKSNFIDCVIWGKQGESLSQYLKKGTLISIESAELEFQKWEKDGQTRSKHSLNVRDIKFAGGKTQAKQFNDDFRDEIPF